MHLLLRKKKERGKKVVEDFIGFIGFSFLE